MSASGGEGHKSAVNMTSYIDDTSIKTGKEKDSGSNRSET